MTLRAQALLTACLALTACDAFNKTSAQIAAPNVMVATVLATPAIVIPPQAVARPDGGQIPAFDGGFDFDGGLTLPDGGTFDAGGLMITLDGGIFVPAQTALLAFFGVREGTDLTSAPTGVADAVVTAGTPAQTWTLQDVMSGNHALTSQQDATLKYTPGVTWTFTATSGGVTFIGAVDDAPGSETIFQLHPDAGYISLAKGSTYELTRPDPPPGEQRVLGFVTVFPLSLDGAAGTTTYTDVPSDPLSFLKLAAAPDQWKQTLVEIPATAFPEANANYVILFQTAKLGGSTTTNLFLGSPMIAGQADVGVVKTR